MTKGKGGGRDEQAEHTGLLGQWKDTYDIVMVDTCHYAFVKPHGLYNTPRVNPKVHYDLGDNDVPM